MRAPGFACLIGLLLAAGVASAADAPQNPRRPRPPLWSAETEGWISGSAISVRRPDSDKPEPPVSILASSTNDGKYSFGTAYAVGPNGLWLTARHVVDHCRGITVEGGNIITQLLVIEITAHERADIALLRTTSAGLDVTPVPLLAKGGDAAEAFEIGFPEGKPAAFASRFIGSTRARRIGTHPSDNDSAVWAITSRLAPEGTDLSGLAGAPVLDSMGRSAGVVIGESLRRGRLITTLPEVAWDVVQTVHAAGITPAGAGGTTSLTADSYPMVAHDLVTARRVARVVCEEKRDMATQGRRIQ